MKNRYNHVRGLAACWLRLSLISNYLLKLGKVESYFHGDVGIFMLYLTPGMGADGFKRLMRYGSGQSGQ